MAVDTQVTSFVDLYTDLQNRVREATGVTSTENQAKRYINIALHDMHLGFEEGFPWAERRDKLITHAEYKVGTLRIREGTADLVGTGTSWNTNNAQGVGNIGVGGKIVIDGGVNVFEILSVTNDTTATLVSNFVGTKKTGAILSIATGIVVTSNGHGLAVNEGVTITDTDDYDAFYTISAVTIDTFTVSATFTSSQTGNWVGRSVDSVNYVYFEDEYALATDFLRPFDQRQFSDAIPIDLISRLEFRRRYVRNNIPGRPTIATINDLDFVSNTTPRRRIQFHKPPNEEFVIPYSYITSFLAVSSTGVEATQLVADTDEPIVPLRYRHAIVFHALYHWYRDKKDDARSQEARAEYVDIMGRITSDNEIGQSRPQLRPRLAPYRRRSRRPWSGGQGRFDLNGKFDRFQN